MKAVVEDHVFMESMPQFDTRTDIYKGGRVEDSYVHEVTFVIRQRNLEELTRLLHDVSNPSSQHYGQHLTRQEVLDLTSNPTSRDAVVKFLNSNGANVVSETLGGEYVTASATIGVWERLFKSEFSTFRSTESNGHMRESVRTEKYWMPYELHSHVESVFNMIDVPDKLSRGLVLSRNDQTEKLRQRPSIGNVKYNGVMTPHTLRGYYNMSTHIGCSLSSQAVHVATGNHYSLADLEAFQAVHGILAPSGLTLPTDTGPTVCHTPECAGGNLDLQYITSLSPGSPTTLLKSAESWESWLVEVANIAVPPLVISLTYGSTEAAVTTGVHSAFTTQAIKLGVMGVTLFAASGDDGVHSAAVRKEGVAKCGYAPEFPAGNPYVTAVGATSVIKVTCLAWLYLPPYI